MHETKMIELENDELSVCISSKGVELQSIMCGGIERMWGGDPEIWGRRGPLLFPLIGRLRDGWYAHEGQRIEAPMHGFSRDRIFEVAEVSEGSVVFETVADEETRAVYPFDFHLSVTFALEENVIIKTHVVKNTGSVPMPFEVGGHEAYATHLQPDEHMSDYYVRFEGIDSIEMFGMDESGILTLPKTELPLEQGRLTKTPEQLGIDTVILENVPGSVVTLASTKNEYEVTVEFADFPYLGIWTAPAQDDASYLCLEPWSALPDAHFSPRELGEKPGVRTLEPGESVTLTYRMAFR